jgi:hypothetical protein
VILGSVQQAVLARGQAETAKMGTLDACSILWMRPVG